MLYYATYRLKGGNWQTTMIFEGKMEARETMDFHAEDRDYIVAKSEKELKRRKKNRSLPERKEKKYKETEK
jgi:hypothetical protein